LRCYGPTKSLGLEMIGSKKEKIYPPKKTNKGGGEGGERIRADFERINIKDPRRQTP